MMGSAALGQTMPYKEYIFLGKGGGAGAELGFVSFKGLLFCLGAKITRTAAGLQRSF